MKVIFINTYHGYDRNKEVYNPGTDGFYLFGMGQFIAREFMKRDYDISFENWRMDLRINDIMEREIDGIQCRIFPSKRSRMLFGREYSRLFVQDLRKEAVNPDTVFHFMGSNNLNYYYFTRFLKKNRVIATHLGGANSYWNYHNAGNNLRKKITFFLRYLGERYILLNNYDHFITICKPQINFYNRISKSVTHMPIFGISNEHLFNIKDRIECRKKMGLPLNKKIILQVGRAYQNRGFDWIIEMLDNVLPDDYYFMFVGINKEDGYYHELINRGYNVVEYSSHEVLADYYNAADVLIYLPHNLSDLNFAGTSYVPLEALMCGTPVVATTMHHFPGDEINEVCRVPKEREDVVPLINEILAMDISRQRCRKIVMDKFSWDRSVEQHWQIYKNIDHRD